MLLNNKLKLLKLTNQKLTILLIFTSDNTPDNTRKQTLTKLVNGKTTNNSSTTKSPLNTRNSSNDSRSKTL